MSRRSSTPDLQFYEAYCFPASPTYGSWCLLTAADVHRLDHRPTFKGMSRNSADQSFGLLTYRQEQGIYFYQNHPIKFVQLVGVVITFEVYEAHALFVLDDSSGATLEVKAKVLRQAGSSNPGINSAVETHPSLHGIDIGSVVKVKGQIGMYRDERQLHLNRISERLLENSSKTSS